MTRFLPAPLVVTRTGRVGEHFGTGSDFAPRPGGWPSCTALLEDVAGSLESGVPLRGRRPTVTPDGLLDWER